jgi:hypothetical protein
VIGFLLGLAVLAAVIAVGVRRWQRRFRVARLVCNRCERDELMYFDVTAVFH